MVDLLCISHLRWDFVWQRPQHLLSRLGKAYRVIFVEEPIASISAQTPHLDIRQEDNNVTIIRLIQPVEVERWIGHNDPLTASTYQLLLLDYLRQAGIDNPLLWLYTPMAWHFAETIPHRFLIYDVMDELSAFKGAPAHLREFEQKALSQADIVFTGGVSLFESKRFQNKDTFLFPSGVEIEHFAQAAQRGKFPKPVDLAAISSPILGYYGVIDERMDLPLLTYLAEAHPDWHIVLIGPVVKINPKDLPQAPNLHYPGMKSYQELPAYLAYFDVALVPFAINEATRYLSPTKTLEYMAARKPIVSTPIKDIATLYGGVVAIAGTPEAFVEAVEAALQSDPDVRLELEQALLAQHTWDDIARRMGQLIDRQVARKTA
jgi:glycosyltransferase involved in cell wall biosynthesis